MAHVGIPITMSTCCVALPIQWAGTSCQGLFRRAVKGMYCCDGVRVSYESSNMREVAVRDGHRQSRKCGPVMMNKGTELWLPVG